MFNSSFFSQEDQLGRTYKSKWKLVGKLRCSQWLIGRIIKEHQKRYTFLKNQVIEKTLKRKIEAKIMLKIACVQVKLWRCESHCVYQWETLANWKYTKTDKMMFKSSSSVYHPTNRADAMIFSGYYDPGTWHCIDLLELLHSRQCWLSTTVIFIPSMLSFNFSFQKSALHGVVTVNMTAEAQLLAFDCRRHRWLHNTNSA